MAPLPVLPDIPAGDESGKVFHVPGFATWPAAFNE